MDIHHSTSISNIMAPYDESFDEEVMTKSHRCRSASVSISLSSSSDNRDDASFQQHNRSRSNESASPKASPKSSPRSSPKHSPSSSSSSSASSSFASSASSSSVGVDEAAGGSAHNRSRSIGSNFPTSLPPRPSAASLSLFSPLENCSRDSRQAAASSSASLSPIAASPSPPSSSSSTSSAWANRMRATFAKATGSSRATTPTPTPSVTPKSVVVTPAADEEKEEKASARRRDAPSSSSSPRPSSSSSSLAPSSIPSSIPSSSSSSSSSSSAPGPAPRNIKLLNFRRALAAPHADLVALRRMSWNGIPSSVRGTVWQLLLGYLPSSLARRAGTLAKRRAEYVEYLREFYYGGVTPERMREIMTFHATAAQAALSTPTPIAATTNGAGAKVDDDSSSSSASSTTPSASSASASFFSSSSSCSDPSSCTTRSECDSDLLKQIRQDVPRTSPGIAFFKDLSIQRSLERVLYTFAVRHPAGGYVQGINDLATPFYAIFISSSSADGSESGMDGAGADVMDLLCSPFAPLDLERYLELEADIFWCLSRLLDGIQDHYTFAQPGIQRMVYKLRELILRIDGNAQASIGGIASSSGGAAAGGGAAGGAGASMPTTPRGLRAPSPMSQSSSRSSPRMTSSSSSSSLASSLSTHSPTAGQPSSSVGLHAHLERENVHFLHFAFRWMNCLLMRELRLPLILRLWDSYLAEETFSDGFKSLHVYVCAAFLMRWSEHLKQMEFQRIIQYLQKLPTDGWTIKDVETLLAQAHVYRTLFHDAPSHLA